jgi:hypothetical protein
LFRVLCRFSPSFWQKSSFYFPSTCWWTFTARTLCVKWNGNNMLRLYITRDLNKTRKCGMIRKARI